MSHDFILRRRKPAALAWIAGGVVAAYVPAWASEPGEQPTIEEVVVTAQKREERLLDTPIAVTAFSQSALEARGIDRLDQVASFTPSVTFDFSAPVSGASNAAAVFIRGVGQSDFALTTEAGVGTYVDGVYMSRSIGGVLDALDIQQIEILRGPQGTLFGRNTIGGAVSITTQRPTFDAVSGYGEATIGSRNRRQLRGGINLPLSDALALRFSGNVAQQDGYVKRIFPTDPSTFSVDSREMLPGNLERQGDKDRSAIRGSLRFAMTDTLELLLSADYARIREASAADVLVGMTPSPFLDAYNALGAPAITIPGFSNALLTSENWVTGNLETTYATGANRSEVDAWGTALTATWNSSIGEIKSISAYRDTEALFTRDADGTPIVYGQTANPDYWHQQFSQELQLVGALLGDRLKYAAGLYYFDESGGDELFAYFAEVIGTLHYPRAEISNRSNAAYAQLTYELNDIVSLTGGLRYTQDRKHFMTDQYLTTGTQSPLIFGVPAGTVLPVVPPGTQVRARYSDVSPRISLGFRLNPDTNLYFSYSEGFKSGGFNLRYVLPVDSVSPFSPEQLDSYEAGLKWQSRNRRIALSSAAFLSKYRDMQVTLFDNSSAPITTNAGASEIKGVEVEMTALPLRELELTIAASYLDAAYTRISPPSGFVTGEAQLVDLSSKLPNTPRFSSSISAAYRTALGSVGDLELRTDWSYTSEVFNDAQNSPFLRQGSHSIGNVALTYFSPGGAWDLRLFVDNVTDERLIVSGDSNFPLGVHEAIVSPPREWGATFKVRF